MEKYENEDIKRGHFLKKPNGTNARLARFVGEKKLVDLPYVPRPGQDCWVDYDRYGKVSRFELVQESK